jgi:hypothetical protein
MRTRKVKRKGRWRRRGRWERERERIDEGEKKGERGRIPFEECLVHFANLVVLLEVESIEVLYPKELQNLSSFPFEFQLSQTHRMNEKRKKRWRMEKKKKNQGW